MIRVAVLSFWHVHGTDYAKEAEDHGETELVAIWDEVPERGRTEAAQRGVRFYDDLDDLLAQPDIDGVIVTTPTSIHRDVMVAAARAGKHIFTEKLIAATLREAEEIIAAVEEAGVTFMVSLRRIADASTQSIKAIIDSGALGEPTLLRVRDSHSGALPTPQRPHGWLPEQFYSLEQAQGGVLTDLCHPVYLARYFLGRPQSVSAAFGYVTGRAVEDNAVVMLRYPRGAVGIVETAYVTQYAPFSIEVHGTAGSVLYSEPGIGELAARRFAPTAPSTAGDAQAGPDARLRIRSANIDGAVDQWLLREVTDAAPKAFDQWVTHMQQGTRATENIELGLDLTAIVEAAGRSVATGQVILLDGLEHMA